MNRMADVARLFGQYLNVPFEIKYLGDTHTIVFNEDGVHQLNDYPIEFDIFHVLFTGEAVIVDEQNG